MLAMLQGLFWEVKDIGNPNSQIDYSIFQMSLKLTFVSKIWYWKKFVL